MIRGGIGQYYQIESTNIRLNFNFLPFDFTQTVNATTNVVPTRTTANFFLGQAFGAGLTPANTPVILGSDTRVREDGKQCALELWR